MATVGSGKTTERIDFSKPRWDQSTYLGRARHFFNTCDPLTVFATNKQLDDAKTLLMQYKNFQEPPGTTEDELWGAKKLYDSAFHPETGEKLFLPGRMSFQVPGNMLIVGCMLTFYKSTPAVIFWQWVNQTFNASVNYTNRNASAEISTEQLAKAYVAATSSAVVTGVGLNKILGRFPSLSNGLLGRFVPLIAMSAANCCNLPLMRQNELKGGITVQDENGNAVGKSQIAARYAIGQVIVSRIAMTLPASSVPPIIMNYLSKKPFLAKYPMMNAPIQCLLISSLKVSKLEPEFQKMTVNGKPLERVYYNKGL